MNFDIVALPMRLQPMHLGHEHYIRVIAGCAKRVVIFLNRKYNDPSNPFSFELRRSWVQSCINTFSLHNVIVPDRINASRREEYRQACSGEEVTVFVTDETENLYRSDGFKVFNHHSSDAVEILWRACTLPEHIKLHSTGRIIRERLQKGESVAEYVPQYVLKDL